MHHPRTIGEAASVGSPPLYLALCVRAVCRCDIALPCTMYNCISAADIRSWKRHNHRHGLIDRLNNGRKGVRC